MELGTLVSQGFVLKEVCSGGWLRKGVNQMECKGIQIDNCPRCSKYGLLIERLTVTRNGNKKYTYRKLNVAHYAGNGISKNGKPVDRIHWCYLNTEQLKQLPESGVRQIFTQNVTQNVRQNESQDLGFFSGVDVAGPRGFEPQISGFAGQRPNPG